MITGFQQQTCELNEIEISLIPGFVSGLKKRIGKKSAITNKEIREAYRKLGIIIPDSRVRKIINHIRINNLVPRLCATSNGYYVAQNEKELYDYIEGLRSRINSQLAVLNVLEKQLN